LILSPRALDLTAYAQLVSKPIPFPSTLLTLSAAAGLGTGDDTGQDMIGPFAFALVPVIILSSASIRTHSEYSGNGMVSSHPQ